MDLSATDELVAFLDSRLAVDEQQLRDNNWVIFNPARFLRDIEAKRAIIDLHRYDPHACSYVATMKDVEGGLATPPFGPCATLRHLAMMYADHRDYRLEWDMSPLDERRDER